MTLPLFSYITKDFETHSNEEKREITKKIVDMPVIFSRPIFIGSWMNILEQNKFENVS